MDSSKTAGTKAAANRWIAALAVAATLLSAPLAIQADESSRSASDRLNVTATVISQCQVDAGTVAVAAGTLADTAAAASAVTTTCAAGLSPRTSVAYERVTANGHDDGERLVVTVMF